MANLLSQMAKGMIFAHKNFTELQRKISMRKFSSRRRPSTIRKNLICFDSMPRMPKNCSTRRHFHVRPIATGSTTRLPSDLHLSLQRSAGLGAGILLR
jgi:hypothetical protein